LFSLSGSVTPIAEVDSELTIGRQGRINSA